MKWLCFKNSRKCREVILEELKEFKVLKCSMDSKSQRMKFIKLKMLLIHIIFKFLTSNSSSNFISSNSSIWFPDSNHNKFQVTNNLLININSSSISINLLEMLNYNKMQWEVSFLKTCLEKDLKDKRIKILINNKWREGIIKMILDLVKGCVNNEFDKFTQKLFVINWIYWN